MSQSDLATVLASLSPAQRTRREGQIVNSSESDVAAGMAKDMENTKRFSILDRQLDRPPRR